MLSVFRLLLALAGRRAGAFNEHAKTKATHIGLLAVFGSAATAFLVALVTVALARWLGIVPALAILAGVCVAACLAVLIAMRGEARAHRLALARQARDERRLMQAALLSALPGLRRGGLMVAALGALALLIATRRGGDDDDRDD